MANVVDQILADLRTEAPKLYPERGELRNVRLVGHTPKSQHYIYDIVVDFADGSERVAAKVYRNGKAGSDAKAKARSKSRRSGKKASTKTAGIRARSISRRPRRMPSDGILRSTGCSSTRSTTR